MKLTQLALAKKMGVDIQLVNGVIIGRRPVPRVVLRFSPKKRYPCPGEPHLCWIEGAVRE